MNVLDLRGPAFLLLYLGLLAAAIVAALLVRWWLRGPGGDVAGRAPELHPFEVAYLAGGPKAVADAAIAGLVHRGNLAVDASIGRILPSGPPPVGSTPLERAVYEAVQSNGGRVGPVRKAVLETARGTSGRLESMGLAVDASQALRVRVAPALVIIALFALGVAKVLVGLDRNRPVGFLIFLCAVTLIASIVFIAIPPRRTRLGTRVLDRLKRQNAALRTTASRAPNTLANDDLAMAFALFGIGAFTFGPMSDLRRAMAPPASGGSGCGGSSSSGCGSGSGGGGGGGCGGCGGGGD